MDPSHKKVFNSSYRGYQRFDMQTRRKGQSCIVLTVVWHAHMTGNQSGAEKDNRLLFREQ